MELLDLLSVAHPTEHRAVAVYQGDLTDLEPEDAVDYVVISALPGDYSPTSGSLIGALFEKGIDVEQLFHAKAVDLRHAFSCWLSAEIAPTEPGIQFRRLLCFEPWSRGSPQETVGDIFRSLAPFLGEHRRGAVVAMPFVATGHLGEPLEEMLPPLVDAAVHWMSVGMPLRWLKIVTPTTAGASRLRRLFGPFKDRYDSPPPVRRESSGFDAFVSYAHADEMLVRCFVEECRVRSPRVRFFMDRLVLDPGSAWQQSLFEGIDRCRRVVTFFSPAYLASKVCKEEFNIGLFRARETTAEILFPIYLFNAALPTYMKMIQFVDCREGDRAKLQAASCSFLGQR
jgi:hypothetical protein